MMSLSCQLVNYLLVSFIFYFSRCVLTFQLEAAHRGVLLGPHCLDVKDGLFENGGQIQMFSCNHGVDQKWSYSETNELMISNGYSDGASSFCLDVDGGDISNGADVQIWECLGNATQQKWKFQHGLHNFVTIRTWNKEYCLTRKDLIATNGEQLNIWICEGLERQYWVNPLTPSPTVSPTESMTPHSKSSQSHSIEYIVGVSVCAMIGMLLVIGVYWWTRRNDLRDSLMQDSTPKSYGALEEGRRAAEHEGQKSQNHEGTDYH